MRMKHPYLATAKYIHGPRGVFVISFGEGSRPNPRERMRTQHVGGRMPNGQPVAQDTIDGFKIDLAHLKQPAHAFLHGRREANGAQHDRERQQRGRNLETRRR